MLSVLIGVLLGLCVLLALIAAQQYYNFHRVRHLLKSGGWRVFHATYGGTTSEWQYYTDSNNEGLYRRWSLSDAYARQCAIDKARYLGLPTNTKD